MSELDFPPFIPAKPKGGVAAEIAQAKGVEGAVESTFDPLPYHTKAKRKRRTAAEMAAANGSKKPKPRAAMVPVDSLVAFAGLTTSEIEQVVNVCEAVNTFPKAARKRIAAAIGQLFS